MRISKKILYIKVCTKSCYLQTQIFIELGCVYRSDKVTNETVHSLGKKILTDTESIKDAANSDQTVEAVTSKVNVRKMKLHDSPCWQSFWHINIIDAFPE